MELVKNRISHSENLSSCSIAAVNAQDELLVKNDFFEIFKVQ